MILRIGIEMDKAIAILEKHLKLYWTEGPFPKDNYCLSDIPYFSGLSVYTSIESLKEEKRTEEKRKAIEDASIEP